MSLKWFRILTIIIRPTHLCERGGSFLFQEGADLRKRTHCAERNILY